MTRLVGTADNRPISVYHLGEMPIQSCGQSVSAPRGKANATLNAHTELQAKRQRSAKGSDKPKSAYWMGSGSGASCEHLRAQGRVVLVQVDSIKPRVESVYGLSA
jgi:hypothetical protein